MELKVSGFETNKNGTLRAKERISLSMINYNQIIHETFQFSKLISKIKKLLIIWYEYIRGIPYNDFIIQDFQLYNMETDLPIIEKDFTIIKNKVLNGQAHLLSEGDTSYLKTATKSSSSKKNSNTTMFRDSSKAKSVFVKTRLSYRDST
ncbi:MutH/Sau3AI family endonuclease [Neobacillus drentensis]|uniref:MutH/Sau3AI family endonuclease n=1 Tax=Neobacillus drentensis TaxID=220684 RepID=UPI003002E9B9